MKEQALMCIRCGQPCQPGESKDLEARPFRFTKKGLCGNCVVTQFLLSADMAGIRNGLLRNGIEVLRVKAIQEQFAAILKVGHSELSEEQIDWEAVLNQWDLPFPKGYQP